MELDEVSPGPKAVADIRRGRKPSLSKQSPPPSLAIGQEAAFPRQRRPSLPKVSAEQLNAQGWARELPVASGAGEGQLVHEALQVNPAQGSELQAPFRAERPQLPKATGLSSLQDTLCKLEADKERSLSHVQRCKKTLDRLAVVTAFQTPVKRRAASDGLANAKAATGDCVVPSEAAGGVSADGDPPGAGAAGDRPERRAPSPGRGPEPASSRSGRGMARPKRRHSSPTRAAGPSILGDGLMLSGTRAEFSASRPARPGSLPREAQAQAELQTHDYLRKGVASTARVRSGSRRRDVNSLENGLQGTAAGGNELTSPFRAKPKAVTKPKARTRSMERVNAPTTQRSEMQNADSRAKVAPAAAGDDAGAVDAAELMEQAAEVAETAEVKELEELDEVEIEEVEVTKTLVENNLKNLRKLMMVIRLWTGKAKDADPDGEEPNLVLEEGDEADDCLEDPVQQVFNMVANVKARSGEWICTQKSFETLLEALQDVDQGRRRGFRRIPLSRIREAFQEQIALQISLSSRYGLSAAEASKGMVYETFRTCMHRLFYRPLEPEEEVKDMLLRHRGA